MPNNIKITGGVIAAVLATVIIIVALYLGFWWLRHDTTNRDAKVQQQTYGRQNALVEQILDDIREAEAPATPPQQRVAIVDIICDSYDKLTGSIQLPTHAQNFINRECYQS